MIAWLSGIIFVLYLIYSNWRKGRQIQNLQNQIFDLKGKLLRQTIAVDRLSRLVVMRQAMFMTDTGDEQNNEQNINDAFQINRLVALIADSNMHNWNKEHDLSLIKSAKMIVENTLPDGDVLVLNTTETN